MDGLFGEIETFAKFYPSTISLALRQEVVWKRSHLSLPVGKTRPEIESGSWNPARSQESVFSLEKSTAALTRRTINNK